MEPQARIDAFSLAAHRLLMRRLHEDPASIVRAIETLQRWRQRAGGTAHCAPYWDEWERLLRAGAEAVEHAVCSNSDHAATLRSVSPLGGLLPATDRLRLLRQAGDAT
jgi:hypothetical protein